jgi:riboflavin kinase/FMN adenylyltransferase
MIVHKGYEGLKIEKPVIALGVFDGLHKGHLELIDKVKACAGKIGGESVILTFDPHPRTVLDPGNRDSFLLTTTEEKISLIGEQGVDHLIIVEFTPEFSMIGSSDFIKSILKEKIGVRCLIIGYDHRFGHSGSDDESIELCAARLGIEVEHVDSVLNGDEPVSSSAIRDMLEKGEIESANNLLGYNYSISGNVVSGRKLGKKLGFPTANVGLDEQLKMLPADGVYAVNIVVEEKRYYGVLSLGNNPTVNTTGSKSMEAHIFDFEGDIYGKKISVSFISRLRGLRKFKDTNELAAQIALDKKNAENILKAKRD